jgi:hypothetical protein
VFVWWKTLDPDDPFIHRYADGARRQEPCAVRQLLDPAFAADRGGSSSLIERGTDTVKIHSRGPDRRLDTADDVLVSQRK